MRRTSPISTDRSQAYAASTEFYTVFTENMASMHLLSFLLTTDPTKAEECFVCGLGDCVAGSYVFRDWAQSWARRTIIQNAIRLLAPRKNHSAIAKAPSDSVSCSFGQTPDAGYAIGSILRLEDFECFVIVTSVLEKCTDHVLRSPGLLAAGYRGDTRVRALLRVAESAGQCPLIRAGFDSKDHEKTATRETQVEPQFDVYEHE